MPLILTEEQRMLRDSARDFLADKAPITQLRALRDQPSAEGFSRPLWREFAGMGFTGVLVPEAQGGLGLGHVEAGVVMEQIGRQLCASPFLASCVAAVSALRAGGNAAQQQHWLPRLASGAAIATLAVDEGNKHRPQAMTMSARPSATVAAPAAASASTSVAASVATSGAASVSASTAVTSWTLDGAKTLVLDGHVADLLIVAARTAGASGDMAGIGLFLVDAKAAGVSIERTTLVDAHNAARIHFHQVEVRADQVLGDINQGWATLSAALNAGRCAAAAELLGLADEAFARTVQYLKERRQFGKVIGEFQALQHRAAHLYTELEITRAALIKAQQSLDADAAKADSAVAVAKAKAGRSATLAVQEAVQMHGGMGMTDALDFGLFMKRARVLQELWGDANFHQDQLAQFRGY